MCGRAYSTYTDEELFLRYLFRKPPPGGLPGLKPNYNLSPTQQAPVLRKEGQTRLIERARWGLIPFWAKDAQQASKYSLINAKGEEIETKRSYREAFLHRRCIVPVSGFYEWKREDSGPKRPFAISHASEPILSLAGVWENGSFSIITTEANSFMAAIHDRMPVILERKDEKAWLDPSLSDPLKLKAFLKPCPSDWLKAHEVSPLVNSPKNNRPELLTPIQK